MTASSLKQALEDVYTSIQNNNQNLDTSIAALKAAMTAAGEKEAVFDPKRLAQGNRQGRKLMQSYFKKRGVAVTFTSEETK